MEALEASHSGKGGVEETAILEAEYADRDEVAPPPEPDWEQMERDLSAAKAARQEQERRRAEDAWGELASHRMAGDHGCRQIRKFIANE